MTLLLLPALFVLLVAGVSYARFLAENRGTGHLEALRREHGGLLRPLLLGVRSSLAENILLLATYPLGWLPLWRSPRGGPRVLLVHGLYHNNAAWLLFRRRLARAGLRDARFFRYSSFDRPFEDLARDLAGRILEILAEDPGRPLALVGHSLGGLLLRAAACDQRLRGGPACLLTLGTPHRGSALARLAPGRLGQSLRPESPLFRRLAALCEPADLPRLALVSPLDNMVLPAANLTPPPGWSLAATPPMAHVAMLYRRECVRLGLEFLKQHLG